MDRSLCRPTLGRAGAPPSHASPACPPPAASPRPSESSEVGTVPNNK